MKKKVRLIVMALLVVVLLVSGVMVFLQEREYRENAESYAEAAEQAQFHDPAEQGAGTETEDDGLEWHSGNNVNVSWERADRPERDDMVRTAMTDISLATLQAINPDVVGWIYIPNTEISYPLLYGSDNDYYLSHTWDRVSNSAGAIFADYRCSADLDDFNTIIYGHRMRNGSMFAGLKYYKDLDYWRSHPAVYILDGSGVHVYDIFAAWEPSVTSVLYTLDFATEEGKQEFLDTCLASNQLNTGITPEVTDNILTLSTCTGNGHATRWVIQAVERK